MKTILHIFVILLVTVIIAGSVYVLVENTTLVSSDEAGKGQPPAMKNADGTTAQMMERSEGGDEHGASSARGLSDVLVTLGKISTITVVVLLLQKGFDLLRNMKLKYEQS